MLLCLQLTCGVESPGRTVTHKVLLIINNNKLLNHLLFDTSAYHSISGTRDAERKNGDKIGGGFVKVIHSYLRK